MFNTLFPPLDDDGSYELQLQQHCEVMPRYSLGN
jgi:hypothetical protein